MECKLHCECKVKEIAAIDFEQFQQTQAGDTDLIGLIGDRWPDQSLTD